jgi:hypothetical protein
VTLFEGVARVPLIIVPPTGPAGAGFLRNATVGAPHFVSHLDLFPTLAELLGVAPGAVPVQQLDGQSLVPLLRGAAPRAGARFDAAFSQITRQIASGPGQCRGPGGARRSDAQVSDPPPEPAPAGAPPCAMGLSMRVQGWRYSAWLGFDFDAARANWTDVRGEELYDHRADDATSDGEDPNNDFNASENVNLADAPAFQNIKQALRAQLQAQWT